MNRFDVPSAERIRPRRAAFKASSWRGGLVA